MEGFLQAIKIDDLEQQKMICSLSRKEAKLQSTDTWQKEQNLYWDGKIYNRHSIEFQSLIRSAYHEMLEQAPKFKEALLATGTKRLFHTIGNPDPPKTILTEKELCDILTKLRTELQKELCGIN